MGIRVSRNDGHLVWGPYNKHYIILGSIVGSSYFGNIVCYRSYSLQSFKGGIREIM